MKYNENNKHKLIIRIIAIILAVLLISGIIFSSFKADAFDANDYDYGGSSDWSNGSDWDSSSDWDSDSDWDSGSDWGSSSDWNDDSDYSGQHSGGINGVVLVVIIGISGILSVCVLYSVMDRIHDKKRAVSKPKYITNNKGTVLPSRAVEIVKILSETDPSFNATDFCKYAETIWTRVQKAWCQRDMSKVRHLMGTNLYNTTIKQVQAKIEQGVIYHYENIEFKDSYLTSYIRDKEFEYLTVYLIAKYIDYQEDEHTGHIIKGDLQTHWTISYKMKFQRTLLQTDNNKICPNCGAPLENIGTSTECVYCGTTITTITRDWVLFDFTTVRDDTVDEGIRIND